MKLISFDILPDPSRFSSSGKRANAGGRRTFAGARRVHEFVRFCEAEIDIFV